MSLWQGFLPFGLVAPARLAPRAQHVAEYTVTLPNSFRSDCPAVPPFILVFYKEKTFGKSPAHLRSLLLDDDKGSDSASPRTKRASGVRVLTTLRWVAKDKSGTLRMDADALDEMVQENWRMYVCIGAAEGC